MSTEIPKGYRKATEEERTAAMEAGKTNCRACAQPKCFGSPWMANHSRISLCDISGENDCENHGFFVKDPT